MTKGINNSQCLGQEQHAHCEDGSSCTSVLDMCLVSAIHGLIPALVAVACRTCRRHTKRHGRRRTHMHASAQSCGRNHATSRKIGGHRRDGLGREVSGWRIGGASILLCEILRCLVSPWPTNEAIGITGVVCSTISETTVCRSNTILQALQINK